MINEYFVNSFEVDREEYGYLKSTSKQKPFSDNELEQLESLIKRGDNFKIISDNIVSIFLGVEVSVNIIRFSNKYLMTLTDKYGKLYYAFPNFEGVLRMIRMAMPKKSKELLRYDDFVYESYNNKLRGLILNEKMSLKHKIEDFLITAMELPDKIKRSWITHSLSLLIGIYSGPVIKSHFDQNPVKDPEVAEIVYEVLEDELDDELEVKSEVSIEDEINSKKNIDMINSLDPTEMKLSQEGWDHIKWEEGDTKKKGEPVLKGYKLKDGRITIGWGHAEPIRTSKFKVGQVITREKAQELLKEDMKIAADGVRRMFKQWKEQGIDVRITQKQFDVLVSIAFNAGVTGLRKSEIVKHLKQGDIQKAGEVIQDTLVGDWSGLKVRREREKEMWFS
jgi:lysozyme